jgi:molybdopterin molybdotransferase
MLSVNEAITILLNSSRRLVECENVDLMEASGRTLAADIIAPIDVPPADNSAMDGYAIRCGDYLDTQTAIPLSQRITAGSVAADLKHASAARIFTGAEVPHGADTVVMQEHCEEADGSVRILKLPAQGANIRRRGQDLSTGQKVLSSGLRLRPQDLGLAASLGIAKVPVYRRLKVAVMSTGDELREPGDDIQPGQIYNSNRYLMKSQLASWGFEVVDLGVARDDPEVVSEMLLRAAENSDVIITSGGVSVGEEDHVKAVVEALGAIDLWRIAIKPGKPFAFGQVGETPFIGLPGNPVSVFVTLLIIARPFLFACQGMANTASHPVRHTALFEKKASLREDYLRVCATQNGVELFSNQSSGVLFSTTWGDGLVRQKVGEEIHQGALVDFLPYAVFN